MSRFRSDVEVNSSLTILDAENFPVWEESGSLHNSFIVCEGECTAAGGLYVCGEVWTFGCYIVSCYLSITRKQVSLCGAELGRHSGHNSELVFSINGDSSPQCA